MPTIVKTITQIITITQMLHLLCQFYESILSYHLDELMPNFIKKAGNIFEFSKYVYISGLDPSYAD